MGKKANRRSPRIATIINFCTNDYQFLRPCIEGVKPFSSQILIPTADHFFDGSPENRHLLNKAYSEHPDCEFIEFAYRSDEPYRLPSTPMKRPEDLDWSRHWHSTARMIGYYYLRGDIDYVLFIDVDEVYEGNKFNEWVDSFDCQAYAAIRFVTYQYFRETRYQSKEWFTSGLMARRDALTPEIILTIDERMGLYKSLPEKKIMGITGVDGFPMIHHYSWVRTKAEMLKKVVWAHFWERDWKSLIEKEFSGPFSGRDFTTESEYLTVEPHFEPFVEKAEDLFCRLGKPAHYATPQKILEQYLLFKLGFLWYEGKGTTDSSCGMRSSVPTGTRNGLESSRRSRICRKG